MQGVCPVKIKHKERGMRNKIFWLIGVLLVFGFVLIGCDTGTNGDTNNTESNDARLIGETFIIEGKIYIFTANEVYVDGTPYSYTADRTTLNIPDLGISYPYSISGDSLTLTTGSGTISVETDKSLNGIWTKNSLQLFVSGLSWSLKENNRETIRGTATIDETNKKMDILVSQMLGPDFTMIDVSPNPNARATVDYNLSENTLTFSNLITENDEGGFSDLEGTWTK
jgi:hypothetical protein